MLSGALLFLACAFLALDFFTRPGRRPEVL